MIAPLVPYGLRGVIAAEGVSDRSPSAAATNAVARACASRPPAKVPAAGSVNSAIRREPMHLTLPPGGLDRRVPFRRMVMPAADRDEPQRSGRQQFGTSGLVQALAAANYRLDGQPRQAAPTGREARLAPHPVGPLGADR